ncbi:MAG: pyridoxal-phosphate dependent enzyme, partial [Lachnospiraceae bacterium]|nr:pyridoxal-phosphate dependent enzyme [Lachnospiraceae bacterium]
MDVYMSIREMIGNTPILKLNNMSPNPNVGIYAKLELMNPAGSVKDRVGMYMIDDAKERGILKEGGTIVDATAGNTGIGIAIA